MTHAVELVNGWDQDMLSACAGIAQEMTDTFMNNYDGVNFVTEKGYLELREIFGDVADEYKVIVFAFFRQNLDNLSVEYSIEKIQGDA